MVQRYQPKIVDRGDGQKDFDFVEDDNGDYVLFADYTALEQKNAELVEKVEELEKRRESYAELIGGFASRDKLIDKLQADNALLRKRLAVIEEIYEHGQHRTVSYIQLWQAIEKVMEMKESE